MDPPPGAPGPLPPGTPRAIQNGQRIDAPIPDACVHELFEAQAARTPDVVAVIAGGGELTYRDLNARANQLARALRARGVGPETLVGVSLERGLECVVALFGVWKAGGAYVPLDPAYPRERLQFMLQDAGVRVLLTSRRSKPLYVAEADRVLCLQDDWAAIAREDAANLPGTARPSSLAYVMYTSGSTGQPKGAEILHRGLVNYLWWAIGAYGVTAGGPVPVHSSLSFDLTVTSLYPALLVGASVEMLPDDVGAQALAAALRASGDRVLVKITPAHLELISRQLDARAVAGLVRTFVIGGDNLPAESLAFWRAHAPGTRLINEYGPTETVVGCCVYEVAPSDPAHGPVPIGRPIANTTLYILDDALRPVPPGEKGELFIGGAGVARGYRNRPQLTSERFLDDPFTGIPGARMYRTGDVARSRADGTIEYHGRTDRQVKVRGYRIELGEIEAALAALPDVQTCAVLARDDAPGGDRRLVGYVVPQNGTPVTLDLVQAFLRERLPEFMVPSDLVVMPALPLTANGKIDRERLPAPVVAPAAAVEAGSETEQAIARLWADLLRVPAVRREDNFFELGGHSLLAMKVVSSVREMFGVDVHLRNLFEQPTVAGLAAIVDGVSLLTAGATAGAAAAVEEIEL